MYSLLGWIDLQYISHSMMLNDGKAEIISWNNLNTKQALEELMVEIPVTKERRMQIGSKSYPGSPSIHPLSLGIMSGGMYYY